MQIDIYGHNLEVSERIEEYVESKVGKLYRYLPNIRSMEVDITKHETARTADEMVVQITIQHERGAILRTEERVSGGKDALKLAVNGAVDKMYTRISRFKGKRKSKRVRERYRATVAEYEIAEDLPDEVNDVPDATIVEDYDIPSEIVRRKEVGIAAMNEDEAVEQMELLGHDFFMFFNMETNTISVLYRRNEGGYGVLVPDMT